MLKHWLHETKLTQSHKLLSFNFVDMEDSSHLLNDIISLHNKLHSEGYLLLENFLPKKKVLKARKTILKLTNNNPQDLLNRQDIYNHYSVLEVLESKKIFKLCQKLFTINCVPRTEIYNEGKKTELPVKYSRYPNVFTFPYKWLRAVEQGKYTGLHLDRYYLNKGSDNIVTFWIPLGNVSKENGAMSVIPNKFITNAIKIRIKNLLEKKLEDGNGESDGWLDESELEGVTFVSHDFKMGDVVVLTLDVLHKTLSNNLKEKRISCDTRWQPINDKYPPW
ncbi:hypothetical protein HK099_006890 [Clydaea vesicula]|uniref:Phytanoyl-CoA dioxygenase n=1 Tax=Clydaea vesicula TaxID=447962 RepID=A0AAD5TXQ7_9FUNG|nr:hypothetical protein HK099_006890 [Clydaea vesicula]KAJ3391340.1 hypothetical protein HDU92_009107 [Lobulomyces angularis]